MVEITAHKENPLLKRTEFTARIRHAEKATPSRKELEESLAAAAKVDKDRLVINRITTTPGAMESTITFLVYHAAADIPVAYRERHQRRLTGAKPAAAAAEKK